VSVDHRNIASGFPIPKENYCDQPYVVVTRDGNWLCVVTTGPGQESKPGQHIVATVSADKGRSWSPLIDVEPSGERMCSWATLLPVPSGRVYAIYNYDYDGNSTQHGGWLMFRHSDDCGRTWSPDRCRIPMRITKRDRENVNRGERQYFWCIDKPVVREGSVFFALPKLTDGRTLDGAAGWIVKSDNILTESDPTRIRWETLPDGDVGVYDPALGLVQEEQNVEVLSDGTLYMVYRTVTGHPAYAVSRDGAHTWTNPRFLAYPDGRPMKTPRACPRIWKAPDGRFLLWFHNNGYPGWGQGANRNPVWISGGIEADGEIAWSQPEILLYDTDPTIVGMSYPDFIGQDGRIWVTETQKMEARVHELDPALLEGVWNQGRSAAVARAGLVHCSKAALRAGESFAMPRLPDLREGGFTIEAWLRLDEVGEGRTVLDSFGVRNRGLRISTAPGGALELMLHDGASRRWIEAMDETDMAGSVRSLRRWTWATDDGSLRPGCLHHVVFIVDGLSKVCSAAVDGRLCDGGTRRIQGWRRLNPYMGDLNDEGRCRVGADFQGRIERLRIYDRYLLTSEALSNWRAGAAAE